MTFWQLAFPTFIGVFLAFIFSILLFHLTNKWTKDAAKKLLEKNLRCEFNFNKKYLEKTLEDLTKTIEKIGVEDKVFYYPKYVNYQRLFTLSYFNQGFLYEKLSTEDLNLIATILEHMNQGTELFINKSIKDYNDGNINKQEILRIISFERDTIQKFIKSLDEIQKKIVPSTK